MLTRANNWPLFLFSLLFNDAVSIETTIASMTVRPMNMEQLVERKLAGETEVSGENLT
jgi:hypothetical protein